MATSNSKTNGNSAAALSFFSGPDYKELMEPIFTLMQNALKIAILSKSQNPSPVRDLIEKAALEITEITQSSWFPLFPIETLFCVSTATTVHVQIVKTLILSESADFRYNGIDYFDVLEKDMRAFNLMKKRYKFAEIFFKDLLLDVGQYLDLIRMRRLNTEHSKTLNISQSETNDPPVTTPIVIDDYSSAAIGVLDTPLFWESSSFLSEQDISGIFRDLE